MATDPRDSIYSMFDEGFPFFSRTERSSTPANSSPYVVTRTSIRDIFAADPLRMDLIARLDLYLDGLSSFFRFPAAIIGGGFIRKLRSQEVPSDLDALVLYSLVEEANDQAIKILLSENKKAKSQNVDLRYCPLDADPIILLQSVCFLSTLYTKRANSAVIENGLLLYDRR